VRGKVFEAMDLAGGNEDKRAGLDHVPLHAIAEEAFATCDEVNLVSVVRFLRVFSDWCIKFDQQRTMGENWKKEIAGRRRAFGEGLLQGQVMVDVFIARN